MLVSQSSEVPHYEGQNIQSRLTKFVQIRDRTAVLIKRCGVSGKAVTQSLLGDINRRHGKINTIIHSSGVLSNSAFNEMDPEALQLQAYFGTKAAGT